MNRYLIVGICMIHSMHQLVSQSPEIDSPAYGQGPFIAADQSNYAPWRNPAGLSQVEGWKLVIAYHLPFGIPELQAAALGFIFPWKPTISISYFQGGKGPLINRQYGLSSGIELGDFRLGLRIRYWEARISGINPYSSWSMGTGVQIQLIERLVAGLFLDNITRTRMSPGEVSPMSWNAGINFNLNDNLYLLAEVNYILGQQWQTKLGVEYIIKRRLAVRTGFNLATLEGYFGIGFKSEQLVFDYALGVHPNLGITHQGAGSYSWYD